MLLLLAAILLLVGQLIAFSRLNTILPDGMLIAGIPVGGLTQQEAAQRLREAYNVPVELHYGEAVVQMEPATVSFELDIDSMLAAAELSRSKKGFWNDFWDYLWNRLPPPQNIPLRATYSDARLRNYLQNEISPRYNTVAEAAKPVIGDVTFQPGTAGTALDIDRAVLLIDTALRSPAPRKVNLPLAQTEPPRPGFDTLKTMLEQTIQVSGFDGLAGLYLLDLQNGQEIHFLYQQGQELITEPDLAFTAASTIKIPILISAFRRVENPNEDIQNLIFLMIDRSSNEASDLLMDRLIAPGTAPLEITADMQTLGLQSTFLAGYFYTGAPLLKVYKTPGNQRTDVQANPDPYNQTTVSEIGALLGDIYYCAEKNGGSLVAAFPGEITQQECQTMIDYLGRNKIGYLLEAGTPDGTKIAHKHGWISNAFGVINTIGDAGIVYTPGGNYVLVMFLHHPVELLWNTASELEANLSWAVYNYYNLPGQ
ncbi:MAG: serine hydrolase [Anaerolineales bacterium]